MAEPLDTAGAVDAYMDSPARLGAQARYSMSNVVGNKPDYEAELRSVAAKTGVPVDTVRAFPDEMKKQATLGAYDFDSMAEQFPKTVKFLADQDKAAVGHDDTGVLKTLENFSKQILDPARARAATPPAPGVLTNAMFADQVQKAMVANPALDVDAARSLVLQGRTIDNISPMLSASERPPPTLANRVTGIGVSVKESFINADQGYSRFAADVLGLPDQAANAKLMQDRSASRLFNAVPEPDTWLGKQIYGGVISTVQQLPGLALSMATGNPAPALVSIFGTTAGQAYGKYRDRGGSVGQSALGSGLEGGLEVATEFLPMQFLTKKIGKMGVGEFARGFLGRELAGEEVNTILSNAVDTAIANPNKTWGEYFAELPEAMAATAVQTFVQTGLLTGAHVGLQKSVMRAQAMQYQAQQAEHSAQVLEAMQTTAQASKLLERSPETLSTYMQSLADEGAPAIYVDSAKLVEAGVDMQALAQAVPSVASQLANVEYGGDLVIPTSELLVNTIGATFAQPLIDHARTSADAMSREEAKVYMKEHGDNLNAEIQRVLDAKTDDAEFKASRDELQTQIAQQLNEVKRFTPKVNEQYATLAANFYSVMAARVGVTPKQFAETYKLGFAGQAGVGAQVLDQDPTNPNILKQSGGVKSGANDGRNDNQSQLDGDGRGGRSASGGAQDSQVQASERTVPKNGPLPGTPVGKGPIANIVNVAEQYARDNGIPLARQSSYAKVDPERAARIAQAYADMAHAPNDPAVREAYENLIKQTTAQYEALVKAGYKFWFIDPANDPYQGNPWNAMRDLQATKSMAVFPTDAGFGSDATADTSGNPLEDTGTGLQWHSGSLDGPLKPVTANDLFRAVHDAFGHGLEGAGFRADGEENAWQAHARLFTGSALGAATSETRGQNSWVNYGPHGEHNRTAKEDTVFADQKTGLMPEWTWTEGFDKGNVLEQPARGQIAFGNDITTQASVISMLKGADLSTFIHEGGHFFLEVQADLAARMAQRAAAGEQLTPGEQSIADDFNKTLEWMGVKATPEMSALNEWLAMPLDQKRQYHETFARGFEAYAFEGQAPSLDLNKVFQTFRAWLVNVYRSMLKSVTASKTDIGQALDVELTPEVRSVFDRMLATTDQIAEAEASRSMGPLFSTPEAAGMTLAEFKAYHDQGVQATQDAVDQLQARGLKDMQWLQNARSRKLKELQKQHDELRAGITREVRAEVMAQPIYRAWAFLTSRSDSKVVPGVTDLTTADLTQASGKLRTQVLRDMYGTTDDAVWRQLSARHMTSDEVGSHPDLVAEHFGFTSGDELVQKLAAAEPPASVIQGMTDQRMLQEHGDLASPAGIERAADEAIHNDARGRFVATELRALERAMSVREKVPGQRNTVDVLARQAREYASTIISRLKVRDIRPGQYTAAEVRASKAAAKAVGDIAKATMHKRNQLINLHAAKAAYAAQDEVKKAVEYFRKFDTPSKTLDPEYRQQIEALLERFDLRTSTTLTEIDKRQSLVEWVQSQVDQGLEPNIPPELLQEANRKSFKEMTVEEVRGLRDTIKQIEHIGRLKNRLLTAQANRNFAEVVDEIVSSIDAEAGNRHADTRTPNTVLGAKLVGLKNFWASHIKAATWARVMDGGKDGGPVWEYLIRTANTAGDSEVVMREKATKELAAIVAPVLKEGGMGGKGVFYPSVNRSLNKEARLAIALNLGNKSNMQRLLGGEGWTIQQLQPVLDSLTATDWKFVQDVWDHFETYRPAIGAKETRIYGAEPNWVEPVPVHTKFGELRGGYYPVKYDPRASERAESHADAEAAKRQLAGAYTSATTRRSFTKDRVDEVNGRPLLYSLDGIYNGVQEVIHDLTWHEWLIDANKLVRNKKIAAVMRDKYGPDVHQQFKKWLEDNATGDAGASGAGEKALAYIRQGVSVAGLGLNIMNAAMQPLGLTQSIVRIGPKWVGRGLAKAIGSPIETNDEINSKSEFMRTRALTRLREINEVRSQVKGRTKAREAIDSSAYFLMMRAQQLVDVPTWWGAYEKAISEGNDEARAVALSDQAVIDAQGSGGTKDQSAIERGNAYVKFLTTFYSFFNTALNLGVQKTMNSENKALLAADYLLLYVVPAILGAALKDALTTGDSGDWDDWEKIRKKLAGEQLSYLFGLMFGVREVTGAVQAATGTNQYGNDYSGPAGVRLLADLAKLGKQINQGEMDVGLRKAIINVAGELLRLPAAQINRTITGIEALNEGKTTNPGAILTGYQEPH